MRPFLMSLKASEFNRQGCYIEVVGRTWVHGSGPPSRVLGLYRFGMWTSRLNHEFTFRDVLADASVLKTL